MCEVCLWRLAKRKYSFGSVTFMSDEKIELVEMECTKILRSKLQYLFFLMKTNEQGETL